MKLRSAPSILFAISLSILMLCGACEDSPRVGVLTGELNVEPNPVDLGQVTAGSEVMEALTLSNVGTNSLRIDEISVSQGSENLDISQPLPTALSAGQSEALALRISVTALGNVQATLRIESNDPERPIFEVPVRFEAVACDDGNVCTDDQFDTTSNTCIHPFRDGVLCESLDRCIIEGRCSQGVCLGQPKICDDNNPCTADFCRQSDGTCLFEEQASICDDDNPCTTDSCGENGCSHTPVQSGTTCDDGDLCTVNDACFSGRCTGAGLGDGTACDDGDSCTHSDTCQQGVCTGESLITPTREGDIVFTFPLPPSAERAFLHRREVSLGESGVFYGLDHFNLPNAAGLKHVVFAMEQCGSRVYEFEYVPPDANVIVSFVRRAVQVDTNDILRLVVGVRQRPENGFRPQTTTYVLDGAGTETLTQIQRLGGETGRSLLPDGSEVFGVIFPLTEGPPINEPSRQNLVIVREDVRGFPLWRHDRSSGEWAEFLGVAGPRVLFWSEGRFGALDFNTGAPAWTRGTPFTSDEMALSAALNIGIIRTRPPNLMGNGAQLIAVEILEGQTVFEFPPVSDALYFPRTDPVIRADGVIGVVMQTNSSIDTPERLDWVELNTSADILSVTPLPYQFPTQFGFPLFEVTRHEDFRDDPFPTVADDGIAYVGYGDSFYAINPGGGIRWSITSTLSEDAFTGTVPLLRNDGVVLINEASRRIIGVRTNGGRMSDSGWASFRHDGRRTNFTPAPSP